MYYLLISLMIIAAILLIIVVLIQNPKGGGISSEFGGSSGASNMFGVQRTTDIVEKITWGLAAFLLVGALLSNFAVDKSGSSEFESVNVTKAATKTLPTAPITAPTTGSATVPVGTASASSATTIPAPAPEKK